MDIEKVLSDIASGKYNGFHKASNWHPVKGQHRAKQWVHDIVDGVMITRIIEQRKTQDPRGDNEWVKSETIKQYKTKAAKVKFVKEHPYWFED